LFHFDSKVMECSKHFLGNASRYRNYLPVQLSRLCSRSFLNTGFID
jgi:hypothetical protein